MNYWNLLVVLCFLVLYLGVALVFIQLRRLREDLEQRAKAPPPPVDDGALKEGVERIEQAVRTLAESLNNRSSALAEELRSDLDAIRADLRFMGVGNGGGGGPAAVGAAASMKSDAYREARLLLANGIDEERVISETGLTVEEVSLLKRIAHQSQDEP